MKVFEILNLDYKGLEKVKENYEEGNTLKALEELKNYYINRKSVYGFIDNVENIVDYAKKNLKEEVQFMVSISEEVCNKEFVFNLPWEMERCHKKIIFNKEIDWNLNPFNDEEWTFMLNRHRYFFVLAESYLFTRDKRYLNTLKDLFRDWIDNNKLRKELEKTSWRTIEVGIRLKNWIKALEILLLENEIDEELLSKILLSINDQLIYIKENSNDSRVLSNWVILEQEGAFIAETFLPELKISSAYKDETINILEDAIRLQVAEDGLHWEQSFQYHNEMVKCFFEILTIAENNNISIPSVIKNKTKDMVYGTLYTIWYMELFIQ
ncbi:heparinase II/III family protein [Clostridium baratii]|uniref:heparinase II/III family protein n=1 Tax=Clostridium baratii TaxID=1561 RepID=UPI0030CF419A